MNKTILVTGCAGFIGYHVAAKLIKNNYKIIGIDNLNNYYDKNKDLFKDTYKTINSRILFSVVQ